MKVAALLEVSLVLKHYKMRFNTASVPKGLFREF
ncbi:hypothetical protein Nwat_0607 [Nitrosococcus watsonii C-113]|uniref:Uncharacterized protein n=1 Tax=Nitrosococcus watsoni (strain C-113) TaxID=105559 RepID=D8KB29_NITWC|nr:hypothetical protein Nwat_0607 [Nitrosococcus watsonii C-113]